MKINNLEEVIVKVQNGEVDLSNGEFAFLDSYDYTVREMNSDYVVISDSTTIQEDDYQDLLEFIRENEVNNIVVLINNIDMLCFKNTSALHLIHFLLNKNCTIDEATVVSLKRGEERKGFLISIN